jgi:hypothetical protein
MWPHAARVDALAYQLAFISRIASPAIWHSA